MVPNLALVNFVHKRNGEFDLPCWYLISQFWRKSISGGFMFKIYAFLTSFIFLKSLKAFKFLFKLKKQLRVKA